MAQILLPYESKKTSTAKDTSFSFFTLEDDIIAVRERAAAIAHIPAFGKMQKHVQASGPKADSNAEMLQVFTWKIVHNRCRRL